MNITVRTLVPGDHETVDAFLAQVPETTVFLRSNLARAGLTDDGSPFTGTWAGAFEGTRMVGVAAQFWNDNVIVGPGPHAEAAAAHAVAQCGRRVRGILGPHQEVVRTRRELGLHDVPARFSSKEILCALPLDALIVPASLADGHLVVRAPQDDELASILDWRMQFSAETANGPDTPVTRREQSVFLERCHEQGHHFVLLASAERVAYCAFNATVGDLVQIGGVWTPPALRARGYARSVVAGALRVARDRGTRRAVLFTAEGNVAAQRAYAAIGFRPVDNYGIVFFP